MMRAPVADTPRPPSLLDRSPALAEAGERLGLWRPHTEEPGLAAGVRANARLTGLAGALLVVLFALEGLTFLFGGDAFLRVHIFVGVLLVPPVLLKLATTGYRFARYYLGTPAYVQRGAPTWVLRAIAPVVAASSVAVLGTGIVAATLRPPPGWADGAHKASVIVWVAAMAVHVLGHLRETPALASADWRGTDAVSGRSARVAATMIALAVGVALAWWSLRWDLPVQQHH